MIIPVSRIVDDLSARCRFYKKDCKKVMDAFQDLFIDYLTEATPYDDVTVVLTEGIRLNAKIVMPRERRNPKTQEEIMCGETLKPSASFSKALRAELQRKYEEKCKQLDI